MNYPGIVQWGSKGAAVKEIQHKLGVTADGDFGANTDAAVRAFQRKNGLTADGDVGPQTWARLFGGTVVKTAPAKGANLRTRAFNVSLGEIGVMETGGNNRGVPLTKYIRPAGGTGPEPWCGDFVMYCYRRAGSKTITRSWCNVNMLGKVGQALGTPEAGDIVRYRFDHTGLFHKWLGGGYFLAVEGNTGASGAVSDSRTGGDGVYHKKRHISQVRDFRRVAG